MSRNAGAWSHRARGNTLGPVRLGSRGLRSSGGVLLLLGAAVLGWTGLGPTRPVRGAGAAQLLPDPVAPPAGDVSLQGPGADMGNNPVFRRDCRRCHGADGKGIHKQRLGDIPDFTDATWQAGRADADLLVSILEGKGAHMPGFADSLGEDEARKLVAYVRAFAGRTADGPRAAVNDFERRYRELEAEMQELMRQFEAISTASEKSGRLRADPSVGKPGPAGEHRQSLRSGSRQGG